MTRWVVVGAGAGGCVVAARLGERSDAEVTLLEAGPDHGAEPAPGDVGPYFDDPARFVTEQVTRRRGAEPEPYPQGFGVGGSSLINGSIVVPFDVPAGCSLPLASPWSDGAVGAALLRSHRLAVRVLQVRAGGRRVTVADHYLRPAVGRGDVAVRTGAAVRRVVFDGRRAVGVVLGDGTEVPADRVVLCAGAIRTPTILLRSGADTPGIGDHLQDHPAFTVPIELRPAAVDAEAPAIAVGAWDVGHHVLAMNHLPGHPGLGALVVGLHVTGSTGRVALPDPDGEPQVHLGQFSDPSDLDRLAAHVADEIGMLELPAWRDVVAAAYVDDRGTPLGTVGDRAAVRDLVERHAGGHYHVAGTCGDGRVTDAGAVRGYEALYVGDASAFRVLPPHNPYAEVVAQAERLVAGWS